MSESTIHKTNPSTIDSSSIDAGAPATPQSPFLENADLIPIEASTIPATNPRRTEFGRYRIQAVLGEGGIGVVYRAWDTQLRREVALKLLRRDSPQQKVRLLREARAQARLDHANICRIYEAGEFEGEPYIAMQCIDGVPLPQMAARLNLQQKVEIGRQVAEALHTAHREGLIHRDVKPANILVEQREDQSLRAYMTDFGLVRDLAEEQGTQTGVILGTWEYMAPEQVRGDVHAVDRRTDVYGLGALLYELFTGHTPYGQRDPGALSLAMARGEMPAPSRWKKDLPADLEAVLLKCLETRMGDRYSSAWAVAEDLQRYLDGWPVAACRLTPTRRAWRWVKRYRWAALAVLSLLLLLGGLATERAFERARQNRMGMAAERYIGILGRMEMLLMNAYLQPAHDVSEDLAAARRLLDRIESSMREEGEEAEGPGSYVLGRGELLLGNAEEGVRRLRSAWTAGYRRPEVEYALVRALLAEQDRERSRAEGISDPQVRQLRLAEIEKTYAAEIESHLAGAESREDEIPIGALRLAQQGRYGEAAEMLGRTRERLRWPMERRLFQIQWAKQQADLLRQEGRYKDAKSGYLQAMEIARQPGGSAASYPAWYEAECALHNAVLSLAAQGDDVENRRVMLAAMQGEDVEILYRSALQAARVYRGVQPDNRRAGQYERQAHLLCAQWKFATSQYAKEELDTVEAIANRTLARDPQDADALRDLIAVQRIRAYYAFDTNFIIPFSMENLIPERLSKVSEAMEQISEILERIRKIQPLQAVDWHNLGAVLRLQVNGSMDLEEDLWQPLFRRTESVLKAALEADRRYIPAYKDLGFVYLLAALRESLHSRAPDTWLERSRQYSQQVIDIMPGYFDAWDNLAHVLALCAQSKASRGENPIPDFRESEKAWMQDAEIIKDRQYTYINAIMKCYFPWARFEYLRGGDFESVLDRADALLERFRRYDRHRPDERELSLLFQEVLLFRSYLRVLSRPDARPVDFRAIRAQLGERNPFLRFLTFLEQVQEWDEQSADYHVRKEVICDIVEDPIPFRVIGESYAVDFSTFFSNLAESSIRAGILPEEHLQKIADCIQRSIQMSLQAGYFFRAERKWQVGRVALIQAEWLHRALAAGSSQVAVSRIAAGENAGKSRSELALQAKAAFEEAIRMNRWLEKRVTPHLRRAEQLLSRTLE